MIRSISSTETLGLEPAAAAVDNSQNGKLGSVIHLTVLIGPVISVYLRKYWLRQSRL